MAASTRDCLCPIPPFSSTPIIPIIPSITMPSTKATQGSMPSNVQDRPAVPPVTVHAPQNFAYTTTYEPVNARMQNPSYVAGTPLSSRDPYAQLVAAGLALTSQTSTRQTPTSHATQTFNDIAGLGAQFSTK